ncbi:MAG TPA: hypothetical protein VFN03_12850 [Trueperaceae bacterium]|nr:hypothetical protein [Trueperaceae bacterium]
MRQTRSFLMTAAVVAVLLAGCTAPRGPSLSATETGAAIERLWQDSNTVGTAAGWNLLPVEAIAAVSSAPLPAGAPAGTLPRGVYAYDQIADLWVNTGISDDLDLNWLHDAVAYRLLIDWDATAPTTMVQGATGPETEVPTGAGSSLTQGGTEVGSLALTSAWTVDQCGNDEPTGASLSGMVGDAAASIALDRFGFTLTDTPATDTVTAEAAATATVGGDSLSAYLEFTLAGQLERDAGCAIVDFLPDGGSVAAGVSVTVAGDQRSADFQTAFTDPVYQSGNLSGIDLDGTLRFDGVLAVSFAGALNDANTNGIPGDQLVLTFADDQTMTLEEFLLDQVGWAPLAALRMMTR